jgi:hypothetical protein
MTRRYANRAPWRRGHLYRSYIAAPRAEREKWNDFEYACEIQDAIDTGHNEWALHLLDEFHVRFMKEDKVEHAPRALAQDIADWFEDADFGDDEDERLTDAYVLLGWLADRGWEFKVKERK